jgi:hypothetical protein
MIEKVDGTLPAALHASPIERVVSGAAEQKNDPGPEKAIAAVAPTYDIRVRVDKKTSEATVILLNPETKAVIREIPGKEMQAASDVIRSLIGPLIDKTV